MREPDVLIILNCPSDATTIIRAIRFILKICIKLVYLFNVQFQFIYDDLQVPHGIILYIFNIIVTKMTHIDTQRHSSLLYFYDQREELCVDSNGLACHSK